MEQREKSKAQKTREVFLAYIKTMLFAFTGGSMTLPLLQQQLSDKYGLLSREKVLENQALGQALPGVISLNAGILNGRAICGWPGAFVAVLGCVLPAFFGMLLITFAYGFLSGLSFIGGAIAGIRAVSVAIILSAGITAARGRGAFGLMLAAAAFATTFFLGWNIILVMIGCGLVGVARARLFPKAGEDAPKEGGADAD